MSLSVGDRLGPYEIVARIGAGGMGEVYQARDSRVGRDVAVKISTAEFGERFEREARAVAALNHPNVCTLHDVGANYLVMELVDGESPRGPLPLDTALHYARQIAEALDAAHEKGIVHRDLKPANIKVRSDGTVKVLDFGLAKIASQDVDDVFARNLTHSPTMISATQPGVILGTAAYMAPEQARGKPVDKRADIWAFGVVFYEMLTGRRAFDGEDVSSIVAAVIQSEPRWEGVPPRVRRLLESCLQKDPKKRLRDIGDVWKLLDDPKGVTEGVSPSRAGWIAAAGLAAVAVVALWSPWRSDRSVPVTQPVMRLEVDLGSETSLIPLTIPTFSSVVISPDGTRLVMVGSLSGGVPKLLTRRLDQTNVTELSGTDGASNPIFSPDSRWVAYWTGKRMAKIDVDGGPVISLGNVDVMTGATWGERGDLLVGTGIPSTTGVLRLQPEGGAVTPLWELASNELFHSSPDVLPGAKAALVVVVGSPPRADNMRIDAVTLGDRTRKNIISTGHSPRYLPSGHLLYVTRSTMFAVPFDVDRLEARGTPVAVVDDIAYDDIASVPQFDVSRTGTLVYRRRGASSASTLDWVDATGRREPLVTKVGGYLDVPRVSPDGKRVALTVSDGANRDIWVYEPQRDAMTRLTFGGESFGNPLWTRDGRFVVFTSYGSGLYWRRADGAGQPQVLVGGKNLRIPTSFTPDGKRLAYFQPDGNPQLWTVAVENDGSGLKAGTPERFLTTTFADLYGVFSPDGRWIAYESNESGRPEVYVRPFPARDGKWLISNSGGTAPVWSPNGRDLFYRAGTALMAVGYRAAGDAFVSEKPRPWAANVEIEGAFDIAPDGRLAAIVPGRSRGARSTDHSVVVVTNFFDELRRRVPVSAP